MKKNIALVILIIMALVVFGCSSDEKNYVENNPDSLSSSSSSWLSGLITRVPVLFGVGDGPLTDQQVRSKGGMGGSSLYWINTITGSATPIGDIGYYVEGIAYDAITNKLYGITSDIYAVGSFKQGGGSQLIEIDMATGAGTLIADITGGRGFSHPTFDSSGTLFALSDPPSDTNLCTIDVINGEANCFPSSLSGGPDYYRGLAFRKEVLYHILESMDYAVLYTVNTTDGTDNWIRNISGLPHNMAYNGDFNPVTGVYWGLGTPDYSGEENFKDGISQNLLIIDIDNGTLLNTIPTIDNLHAITFGYLNASTLIKMGLNDLIDFLCPSPNNPE